MLSIEGTVTVGEDYEQRISPKLPWRDLFWAALSRLTSVDREHFVKLLILSALWKGGTPADMVAGVVDSLWTQLDEFVRPDLTLEDFEEIGRVLHLPGV